MKKIKIFSTLISLIILISSFRVISNAENNSSYLPQIIINPVGFVRTTELCQINIFLYNFDKIALEGGMYNLRISLPDILTLENVYKDGTIISDNYKISDTNILTFSGDFHYDNTEEFGPITKYTILGKIKDGAKAGKYNITLEENSMLIEENGDVIDFDYINGILRITLKEDCVAGDVNNDELIEADDMILLKKYLLSVENGENIFADTNADGLTDVRDIIFLKKYLVSNSPIIYLSANGDDRNSGSDITTPVRTLNKAFELVSHNGKINIVDTYSVGSDFKWNHHFKQVTISSGEFDITSLPTFLIADNISFENINIKVCKGTIFCTGGYSFSLGEGAAFSDAIIFSTATTPPESSNTESPETDSNTNKTGFPIVNNKEKLSIMCATRTGLGDIANSEFTTEMEKLTNIEIEWQISNASIIDDAKVLALQSGNMPDIFATDFTDEEMNQYSKDGSIVEITKDTIKEWAPNIYKTYEKYPDAWSKMATSDGKMYSLAGLDKEFNYAQHYWFVRTSWLKKLGLSKPKTMDQFYEMLVAFKNCDPNGNGQLDEIPLATWHHDGFIFAPWGFNNAIDVDTNGKVYNMYTTSNMENAVTYWAKVYKESLVSKNVIDNWSGGNAAFMTLIGTGKVGCFWYGWPSINIFDYETLEYPTAGNNGTFPAQAITVTPMASRGSFYISKNCQNVPAALRWIDYLFTNDGYVLKQYGTPGKAIKKTSENTYELTGTPASANAGPKEMLLGRNFLDDGAKITNEVISTLKNRRYAIDVWCETTLKNNGQKFMPTNWMTLEEINNEKLYSTYWKSVEGEWWNFVQGKKNMGDDWTALINEMKNNGIEEYVSALQNYYDRCQ